MQLILASAKIMRMAGSPLIPLLSQPAFEREARKMALELAARPIAELSKNLHCSQAIALEAHQRYQQLAVSEFRSPAILAYNGQAYKHLRAADFSADDFLFAQDHLSILSFLYGMLRPFDGIVPYRLEGNIRLHATDGKTLFAWWKDRLTDLLIDKAKSDDGVLLHLATEEYEHLFDWRRVEKDVRVVKPYFFVDQGSRFKIVSMYAKACRGAMARFVIQNRLSKLSSLQDFTHDGFVFQPRLGDADHPHYIKE